MYKTDGTPYPRPVLPKENSQSRNTLRFLNNEAQPYITSKILEEALEKKDDSFKLVDPRVTNILGDVIYQREEEDGVIVSYLRNGGTMLSLAGAIHPYIPFFPYPDGSIDTEDGVDILVRQESLFPILQSKDSQMHKFELHRLLYGEAHGKRFSWAVNQEVTSITQRQFLSPYYTTCWKDLPKAK